MAFSVGRWSIHFPADIMAGQVNGAECVGFIVIDLIGMVS
jgi:hypothetical protein